MDISDEELDRATGEGAPEATLNVVVELDPEVKAALEEFNRTAPFGKNERGEFIRNDATQVQMIQELAMSILHLCSGGTNTASAKALAVLQAADQADAGRRRAVREEEGV